ncbi:hypothetical protein C8F04DRAFT_65533 [Mycena alexandri]|uniref:BTB domain-containing protein n=1 Tax=Mycena alexandri TaxID=1745969 RepID=A0AAD6S1C4_9AGAR|nr:hypothetical protein C8F04DRAFT_334652 [Mycena alexandri]KAJ7028469.1 hypothetical protein C8F04DRAFT_65533 [Mycena alexandri]
MDTKAPAKLQEPVHDKKYFFKDGDCMLLVDGTLFKLHKVFLSRDPESMFRDIFSLPQTSLTSEPDLSP